MAWRGTPPSAPESLLSSTEPGRQTGDLDPSLLKRRWKWRMPSWVKPESLSVLSMRREVGRWAWRGRGEERPLRLRECWC